MTAAHAILAAVLLAQIDSPSPGTTGGGLGWAVIVLALGVFLVAVLGGMATVRRRLHR
jgi:hypothetical protein